ncbi:hypothetical protein AB205_0179440, partial [Aquarana catesbeiana]
MNNKFKDPEFLTPFIEKYREMRNLWEVKHPQYYIKSIRKATLEKLLAFVQTFIPEATVEILERKIGILRNMYRREHNKIQASLRSGADDVYVPRLCNFQNLRFLDDQTEARESLSTQPGPITLEEPDATIWSQDELSQDESLESGRKEEARTSVSQEEAGPSVSQEETGPSVSQEETGPSVSQEVAGPSVSQEVAGPSRSLTQLQVPPLCLQTKRPRKVMVTEEASMRLMREATNFLKSPPNLKRPMAPI